MKFVGVSNGDTVAQVARSVERAPEIDDAVDEAVEAAEGGDTSVGGDDAPADATIDGEGAGTPATDEADVDGETEES